VVPLAADVRLDELADGYELSGGHIKEVVLRAASMAHAAGERLCQRHLLRSVEAEYRKLGMLSPLSGMASPNERASKFRNEVLQRAGREQLSQQSEEQG
jgi:hypothetical protein